MGDTGQAFEIPFKHGTKNCVLHKGSENRTASASMAEKIRTSHQIGTENVLKCTDLNTGCFGWYRMVLSVPAISDGICVSSRYKKCSSNPVASTFNFFLVATLFFSSPFHRRQQLFVMVSSSFLSFSFSFYLLLSLFYPTLFISLPSCTPCFKK